MINIKDKRGITLITLSIAIIIMVVISSTLVYNINTSVATRNLNNMYSDVTLLKDKVDIYYAKFGDIPAIKTAYTQTSNLQNLNPNDGDVYYVIDLEALDNITLFNGASYEEYKTSLDNTQEDLYVINEKSHNVYYVKGVKLDGNVYYTIPGTTYTEVITPKIKIQPGEITPETIKHNYTDPEGKTATIPAGFTVSGIESEQTIANGLVIYDIPEEDLATINWEADTDETDGVKDVQKLYNQFVWIPCTIDGAGGSIKYDRYAWDREDWEYGQTKGEYDSASQSYKIIRKDNTEYYFYQTMPTDEETSVSTYGGYYIGRYEAGILSDTARSYGDESLTAEEIESTWGKALSQAIKYGYNYVTFEQSKALSERMYTNNVTSKMCSSYAWDTALKFIESQNSNYPTNSTGNYDVSSGGTGALPKTGYDATNTCNIYDIGGNYNEWVTEEANFEGYLNVIRGGSFNSSSVDLPASNRYGEIGTNTFNSLSFRVTLFL